MYYPLSVEVSIPRGLLRTLLAARYLGAHNSSLVSLQVGHLCYWGLGIVSLSFSLNNSTLLSSRFCPPNPSGNPLSVVAS